MQFQLRKLLLLRLQLLPKLQLLHKLLQNKEDKLL